MNAETILPANGTKSKAEILKAAGISTRVARAYGELLITAKSACMRYGYFPSLQLPPQLWPSPLLLFGSVESSFFERVGNRGQCKQHWNTFVMVNRFILIIIMFKTLDVLC